MLPGDWRRSALEPSSSDAIRASRPSAALASPASLAHVARKERAGAIREAVIGKRRARRPASSAPWASSECSPWRLAAAPGRRRCSTPTRTIRRSARARPSTTSPSCRRVADQAGADRGSGRGEAAAGGAVGGGAIGGAAGAAGGAIAGAPGTGAAIGAASGAAAGLVRSLFRSDGPSQAYRNVVDRCLRERGYEPVGWD